jgi:membrane dipeptidase
MDPATAHQRAIVVDGCSWTFDGWTEKLAASGATVLNLTLSDAAEGFEGAVRHIERARALIARDPARFVLARKAADIRKAKAEGKIALVFNFQNGRPIEDRLHHLEIFHEIGLRNMQLTYNERNFIGDGCLEPANSGLSAFGRRVVKEMNRLGMTVDLTHVGERTTLEAMEISEQPCVFSHSNPRRRVDNPRNLTDEQIRRCAAQGGVVGICGWGPICWTGEAEPPGVSQFVGHVKYVADLVGIDHVGVSTDSTSSMRTAHIVEHATEVNAAYPTVTGKFLERWGTGLEYRYPVSITHLPAVTARLVQEGFSEADAAKVMGGNFLRVWEQVWRG